MSELWPTSGAMRKLTMDPADDVALDQRLAWREPAMHSYKQRGLGSLGVAYAGGVVADAVNWVAMVGLAGKVLVRTSLRFANDAGRTSVVVMGSTGTRRPYESDSRQASIASG